MTAGEQVSGEDRRHLPRDYWVAQMLLDAPHGTLTRRQLVAAAPVTGSTGKGSRAGIWVRKGIRTLELEGLVRRADDNVIAVDLNALADWLYDGTDTTPQETPAHG